MSAAPGASRPNYKEHSAHEYVDPYHIAAVHAEPAPSLSPQTVNEEACDGCKLCVIVDPADVLQQLVPQLAAERLDE